MTPLTSRMPTNFLQRGFVLAATLWMLAILAVAASYFAQRIHHAREMATLTQTRTQAIIDLHATKAEILYRIATTPLSLHGLGTSPSESIALDDRTYAGLGDTLVHLQDDRGLLNLNLVDDNRLDRFLSILGAPAAARSSLIDALRDYIDDDNLKHLNGAEAPEYTAAGLPPPRNAFLISPFEARHVFGWGNTPSLWKDNLLPRLSVTSGSFSLNPNTAPWQILATLPGMTPEAAQAILQARRIAPISSISQIESLTGTSISQDPFMPSVVLFPAESMRITQQSHSMNWGWQYNVTLTPVSDTAPWRIDYFYQIELASENDTSPDISPLPPRATRTSSRSENLSPFP